MLLPDGSILLIYNRLCYASVSRNRTNFWHIDMYCNYCTYVYRMLKNNEKSTLCVPDVSVLYRLLLLAYPPLIILTREYYTSYSSMMGWGKGVWIKIDTSSFLVNRLRNIRVIIITRANRRKTAVDLYRVKHDNDLFSLSIKPTMFKYCLLFTNIVPLEPKLSF